MGLNLSSGLQTFADAQGEKRRQPLIAPKVGTTNRCPHPRETSFRVTTLAALRREPLPKPQALLTQ